VDTWRVVDIIWREHAQDIALLPVPVVDKCVAEGFGGGFDFGECVAAAVVQSTIDYCGLVSGSLGYVVMGTILPLSSGKSPSRGDSNMKSQRSTVGMSHDGQEDAVGMVAVYYV